MVVFMSKIDVYYSENYKKSESLFIGFQFRLVSLLETIFDLGTDKAIGNNYDRN